MIGCVVLTQGRRPESLQAALASLRSQEGVELDVVVVGNGWDPGELGIHKLIDEGIPAGRNFGAAAAKGELLFFLDDDAGLLGEDVLARLAARFEDGSVGMVQPRVEVAGEGRPEREWVPRLRAGDRTRSSEAVHVWEGAVMVRRAAFDAAGGWPGEFRFVHEGVELGWRVLDAGYRILYDADVAALHPPYGERNDWDFYYGARNRVWLARRNLPLAFALPFVLTFFLRSFPRATTGARRRAALRGYRDGFRGSVQRRPLKLRTLWRMTRLGRPPVL
jgi:GT2 family glycosyltransferase